MNNIFKGSAFFCRNFLAGKFNRSRVNFRFVQVAKMGLLSEGSPLSWDETKALAEHVRQHGIEQFINLYCKLQERTGDVLKWGDEVCLHPVMNFNFRKIKHCFTLPEISHSFKN